MKHIYYLLLSGTLLLSACNDVELKPISHEDDQAPANVTSIVTKAIPGGVIISYQLPADPDLLYVEAAYELSDGKKKTVNASYNTRSISVEGFAEVKEYQVTLTSVDRSGNRSKSEITTFTPETPPIIVALNSLDMQPDFGGVRLEWENPSKSDLAVFIYRKDSIGDDVIIDTQYSSATNGSYTVRGQDTLRSEYSIRIRDKWNNYSEKKVKILTPIFEMKLDPKKFSSLGTDFTSQAGNVNEIPKLWDDNRDDNAMNSSKSPWYVSFSIFPTPVRLSRVIIWQYAWPFNNYGQYYAGGNGRFFELWGTNSATPTTDMSGWTLLRKCEIVKPSGLPFNIGRDFLTDEDFELARNKGHEFMIPLNAPAVRYIRLVSVEGFETELATPADLYFYGDPR